jgi:hypothetical protein
MVSIEDGDDKVDQCDHALNIEFAREDTTINYSLTRMRMQRGGGGLVQFNIAWRAIAGAWRP